MQKDFPDSKEIRYLVGFTRKTKGASAGDTEGPKVQRFKSSKVNSSASALLHFRFSAVLRRMNLHFCADENTGLIAGHGVSFQSSLPQMQSKRRQGGGGCA